MNNVTSASSEWKRYWFLPVAAALGYATSVIHVYSMGPFIEPLQAEFGWSRAQVSSGLSISAIISALFCIPIGMLVDRVGPRRVGLVGAVLILLAYAALGTATGSTANWMFLWCVLAVATFGVQTTVWTSAVTSRFEASRGLALAITLSGASVAATLFPLLATWLIGSFSWRTAFMASSGIWAVVVLPVLFLAFRGARDGGGPLLAKPDATVSALSGVSFLEGIRMPALYKLLVAAGLFTFTAIGMLVHFVPLLTAEGSDPLEAAGVASLIGIFSIFGRLAAGLLLDRYPGHLVGAVACLFPILSSALLLFDGGNVAFQILAAIALGLTLGAEVDVVAYLASRHFGLKSFGALYGALVMALGFGVALGPLVAGSMFDRFGDYREFLMLGGGAMLVSALALLSLGPAPTTFRPSASEAGEP
jgi:MFS family permease